MSTSLGLAERTVIITGASAGIGAATALRAAEAGATVIANARREQRLNELAEKASGLPGKIIPAPGDASLKETAKSLLSLAPTADAVIVNAGRGLQGSITTSNPDEWEEVVKVNVLGALYLMRETATRFLEMRASGYSAQKPLDIVVIGSNVGRNVSPFSSVYGSTKFAVNSLAEALRRELGPKNIRVTLVEPGIVETEFWEGAKYSDELVASFKERFSPLLVGDDIARPIVFALSQPAHVHMNNLMIRPTRQDYP